MSRFTDPEHLVACPHCGAVSEVSEEVHHRVPVAGMKVGCYACGDRMTVPPTRETLAAVDRARVEQGVFLIAYGEVERGKAILRDTEGAG